MYTLYCLVGVKGATHICFPLGKEEVSTHGQAVRCYLESKPESQRAENILCTGPFSSSGTGREMRKWL